MKNVLEPNLNLHACVFGLRTCMCHNFPPTQWLEIAVCPVCCIENIYRIILLLGELGQALWQTWLFSCPAAQQAWRRRHVGSYCLQQCVINSTHSIRFDYWDYSIDTSPKHFLIPFSYHFIPSYHFQNLITNILYSFLQFLVIEQLFSFAFVWYLFYYHGVKPLLSWYFVVVLDLWFHLFVFRRVFTWITKCSTLFRLARIYFNLETKYWEFTMKQKKL